MSGFYSDYLLVLALILIKVNLGPAAFLFMYYLKSSLIEYRGAH